MQITTSLGPASPEAQTFIAEEVAGEVAAEKTHHTGIQITAG